jgi:3-oxoacid CoA-transferase
LIEADTFIQTGEIPTRMGPADPETRKSSVLESGKPRETRIFNGRTYVMEEALTGDVAIIRAWKVDEAGNCMFRSVLPAEGNWT